MAKAKGKCFPSVWKKKEVESVESPSSSEVQEEVKSAESDGAQEVRNCNLLDATNWLWRYNIIPLAMKDIF